jgi:hypothetical protein
MKAIMAEAIMFKSATSCPVLLTEAHLLFDLVHSDPSMAL